jgi:hypothetical protein
MIDSDLFYSAAAGRAERRNQRGPSGDFVNLFVGLVQNKADNCPCHIHTSSQKRAKNDIMRRFVSYNFLKGVKGSCPLSVDYALFERVILDCLREISPSDLVERHDGVAASLADKLQELGGIEAGLADWTKQIAKMKKPSAAILNGIAALEEEKEELKQEIERLKQDEASQQGAPLTEAKSILVYLDQLEGEVLLNARLKLRSLISALVSRIEIDPFQFNGRRVGANIKVFMRSGEVRWELSVKPKGDGDCSSSGNEERAE